MGHYRSELGFDDDEPQPQPQPHPQKKPASTVYRYRGRDYIVAVRSTLPGGPCTLVSVDEPKDTVETTNTVLAGPLFERVGG